MIKLFNDRYLDNIVKNYLNSDTFLKNWIEKKYSFNFLYNDLKKYRNKYPTINYDIKWITDKHFISSFIYQHIATNSIYGASAKHCFESYSPTNYPIFFEKVPKIIVEMYSPRYIFNNYKFIHHISLYEKMINRKHTLCGLNTPIIYN